MKKGSIEKNVKKKIEKVQIVKHIFLYIRNITYSLSMITAARVRIMRHRVDKNVLCVIQQKLMTIMRKRLSFFVIPSSMKKAP